MTNEESEREICAEFLDSIDGWMEASRGYRIGRLMELRAQARREIGKPVDDDAERVHCEVVADSIELSNSWECRSAVRTLLMSERAEASADAEARYAALATRFGDLSVALDSAHGDLMNANAEIAQLRRESSNNFSAANFAAADVEMLKTQLHGLRLAAENIVNSECTWNVDDRLQFDATDKLRAVLSQLPSADSSG